uniref:Uncharacterized protein n=1 Tax=Timema bartmani TaxID=61472 RepID=A0A7R9EY05_9NEOP|nr:unnamed protein product [Timema bartmani]
MFRQRESRWNGRMFRQRESRWNMRKSRQRESRWECPSREPIEAGVLFGAVYRGALVTDGFEDMDCGAVQVVERVGGAACASAEERDKGLTQQGRWLFTQGQTALPLSLPLLVTQLLRFWVNLPSNFHSLSLSTFHDVILSTCCCGILKDGRTAIIQSDVISVVLELSTRVQSGLTSVKVSLLLPGVARRCLHKIDLLGSRQQVLCTDLATGKGLSCLVKRGGEAGFLLAREIYTRLKSDIVACVMWDRSDKAMHNLSLAWSFLWWYVKVSQSALSASTFLTNKLPLVYTHLKVVVFIDVSSETLTDEPVWKERSSSLL